MHLSEKPKQQPLACQNCSQVNFERAKTAVPHLIEFPEKDTALILYRTASQLKQNKHHAEAEETFIKLLELPMDWPLKGKIYFHLGELALHKSNYPQALSFMKLAVQYCFDHKMAFIYLYFLMMLLEKPQIPKTGFVRKETYLEKISQSLGISLEVQP
jgi:tetratricopeptide (TPR) repeat protein